MLMPEELKFLQYLKVPPQECSSRHWRGTWYSNRRPFQPPHPAPQIPPSSPAGRQGPAQRVRVSHQQAGECPVPARKPRLQELLPPPGGQGRVQVRRFKKFETHCSAQRTVWPIRRFPKQLSPTRYPLSTSQVIHPGLSLPSAQGGLQRAHAGPQGRRSQLWLRDAPEGAVDFVTGAHIPPLQITCPCNHPCT